MVIQHEWKTSKLNKLEMKFLLQNSHAVLICYEPYSGLRFWSGRQKIYKLTKLTSIDYDQFNSLAWQGRVLAQALSEVFSQKLRRNFQRWTPTEFYEIVKLSWILCEQNDHKIVQPKSPHIAWQHLQTGFAVFQSAFGESQHPLCDPHSMKAKSCAKLQHVRHTSKW